MTQRTPPRAPITQEHQPPTREQPRRGQPVLIGVFPTAIAVPLPPLDLPVGRDWLARVGMPDAEASGEHLCFRRSGSQLQLEDLQSRNGTKLNGQRLPPNQPVPLADGAILVLGKTILVFREAFDLPLTPRPPVGGLVGPFGLGGVRARLDALASHPVGNVLLQGETGTGKELLAREVGKVLRRPEKRYVAVNITGFSREVFEGNLFGWERGAFSGSVQASAGVVREHDGGAIFLDEIGDLPLDLQPKLLRLLENRELLSVGATRPSKVDVAIIAATNRDLDEMVRAGSFRQDLLARFIARIDLPSLRDRPEDLFAIVEALWNRRHGPLDRKLVRVEAIERLMFQEWPGNVRDLDRLVASINPAEGLKLWTVEPALGPGAASAATPILTPESIARALADCNGNESEAARRLGVDRARLRRAREKLARGKAIAASKPPVQKA